MTALLGREVTVTSAAIVLGSLLAVGCAALPGAEAQYRVEEAVSYKQVDGQSLTGDLYLPKKTGIKPAVLVVHGGGWRNRSGEMGGISKRLAKAGFVVFNATYRLAPENRHPTQVEDVSDALQWLYDNAPRFDIDPQRIGGWGYSAGAHLILMAGLDRQQAPYLNGIVAGGTPADLTAWPNSPLVFGLIGEKLVDAEQTWREASPVNHVSEQSPPVFLYHGQWDKLVEPEQMTFMQEALEAKSVPVETYTVKFTGHIGAYLLAGGAERKAVAFLSQRNDNVAAAK
ncbi:MULTISPECIES: alpha/beta hydrolase [Spongiibacter]|uniref:alpha/beta hydrolase n=2 Tax=Spongiibacteraceae TaxID=1706375 RepID=UPI000C5A5E2E|nr:MULTISPECIES: alpha/beta hydrolase [Spongiibacter]MAY40341.1 hypothetical protein [Spongiibacter sp.]MBI58334.1 hypothetical protein [Spongiibacter sp.]|tara:strand:+ start:8659 stop:9513 length:855 start_codon:yes stop_codon:yes gene_type:complete